MKAKRVFIIEDNLLEELKIFFAQKEGLEVTDLVNSCVDVLEVKNKPKANFIWLDHRTLGKKDRINVNQIVYIEIEAKDYIKIVTTNSDYRLKSSLETFSKDFGLLRLRDNTAVNANYVCAISLQDYVVYLSGSYGGKTTLGFSYTFLSNIKNILGVF